MGTATDSTAIGEDTVKCEMTRSSSDGAFWSANISDAYQICKSDNVLDRCKAAANVVKPLMREASPKFEEKPEP